MEYFKFLFHIYKCIAFSRIICILISVLGGYQYNDFAWELVSASVKSAYICEIDRKSFDDDRTTERDFGEYRYTVPFSVILR